MKQGINVDKEELMKRRLTVRCERRKVHKKRLGSVNEKRQTVRCKQKERSTNRKKTD
jgi:hypothetical protein